MRGVFRRAVAARYVGMYSAFRLLPVVASPDWHSLKRNTAILRRPCRASTTSRTTEAPRASSTPGTTAGPEKPQSRGWDAESLQSPSGNGDHALRRRGIGRVGALAAPRMIPSLKAQAIGRAATLNEIGDLDGAALDGQTRAAKHLALSCHACLGAVPDDPPD